MHKKRVNSVLKGVLVAGTAIGGASVMTEANVVYAAENEFSEGEEIVLPLEDEAEEDEASMLDSMSVSAAESTAYRNPPRHLWSFPRPYPPMRLRHPSLPASQW